MAACLCRWTACPLPGTPCHAGPEADHFRLERNLACLVAFAGHAQDPGLGQVRERFDAQVLVPGLGQFIQANAFGLDPLVQGRKRYGFGWCGITAQQVQQGGDLGMRGQGCIDLASGFDDAFEERFPTILHIAQIGGGFRPGQVAIEGLGQIEAQDAGTHEGEVVNAQCSCVLDDLGFGALGAARLAPRHGTPVKQRGNRQLNRGVLLLHQSAHGDNLVAQ